MKHQPKKILIAVFSFLILDAIWLGILSKDLYINAFPDILRHDNGVMQPNWLAAMVVYVALILGILVFAVPKAQSKTKLGLLWGAVYGFVTYATYDFTNLAVLKDWTLKISIIDTIWGMVLCGLVCAITVRLSRG